MYGFTGFLDSLHPTTLRWLEQTSHGPSDYYCRSLDAMIRSLDKNSLLTNMFDRFFIFATEQQAHARISIINPTATQITEVNSPTWAKKVGYTGNGSTSYLNTNFNPVTQGVNYAATTRQAGVYTSSNTHNTSPQSFTLTYDGVGQSSEGLASFDRATGLIEKGFTGNLSWSGSTTTSGNTSGRSDGLLVVTDNNTQAGANPYRNGANVGNTSSYTHNGSFSYSFFIFARNSGGTPDLFSPATVNMVFFGAYMNATQQATLYTILQAFATKIGFNV